ncbi:hypothetical protein [Chryseobacterium sp. sg2396]|uniref:hypothetical protein n=1 Tax=Chryseobacterium sp. sg2396 TaxID=3276280 RepID=UPI0036719E0E
MKIIYYIIVCMVIGSTVEAQNVGIGTETPTRTLDINGETRIRMLPSGNMQDKGVVTVDQDGNLYRADRIVVKGDLKSGLETQDHKGWYLLDGRSLNSLSASARNAALSLGFTSNLPNAEDRIIKTRTSGQSNGTIGGNNTTVLVQANIPAYTMTAAVNGVGNHTHSWEDQHTSSSGTQTVPDGSSYAHYLEGWDIVTSGAGQHTHSASVSTGGSSAAFSVLPQYLTVNTFIYLGE